MRKSFFAIVFVLVCLFSMFSLSAYAAEMADGTYEVNIALWHSEDDKESMAADAIGTKATIVVENGVKTMHITSGEMSMMGIKASLQELRIADENGTYTDAKIESKNSEGSPTGFYFTMPHTDEYITVKVNPHLAIMGNKDIGARIRVDYSTLKLIKAAEVTTAAENGTADVQPVSEESETVETAVTLTESEVQTSAAETEDISVQTVQPEVDEKTKAEDENYTVIYIAAAVAAAAIVLVIMKEKRRNKINSCKFQ